MASSSLHAPLAVAAPHAEEPATALRSYGRRMGAAKIWGSGVRLARVKVAQLGISDSVRRKLDFVARTSRDMATRDMAKSEIHRLKENIPCLDPFEELKHRFLEFKQHNFLENSSHYQNLAKVQEPKFMVISCADSRVCPSKILGFQPGEAFTIRNVANLVPPFQHGASETSAALEFAVNSLGVGNILVVGHSRCGGIEALMSMPEKDDTSSFIKDWVTIAKSARLSTEAVAGHLSFEQQCRNCEKESINGSLLNLLSYPWIRKKVVEGNLVIHGGYYDFVDCTFEKWTLVYREKMEGGSKYDMVNHSFWS